MRLKNDRLGASFSLPDAGVDIRTANRMGRLLRADFDIPVGSNRPRRRHVHAEGSSAIVKAALAERLATDVQGGPATPGEVDDAQFAVVEWMAYEIGLFLKRVADEPRKADRSEGE